MIAERIAMPGDDALRRSIVMMPGARGAGAGRTVTAELVERLPGEGIRTAYLLTISAAGFFESLGFKRTDRTAAPAEIMATRQAASLCPASAILVSRPTKR